MIFFRHHYSPNLHTKTLGVILDVFHQTHVQCSGKSGIYQNRIQLELNHFSPLLPLLPDYHGLSQYLKRS